MRVRFLISALFVGFVAGSVSMAEDFHFAHEKNGPSQAKFHVKPPAERAAAEPNTPPIAHDAQGNASIRPLGNRAAEAGALLESFRTLKGGDGGGADVVNTVIFQTSYVNSACGSANCAGPCNEIVIIWDEVTPNGSDTDAGQGVFVIIDHLLIPNNDITEPLVAEVPGQPLGGPGGTVGITFFNALAGDYEITVEARLVASSETLPITILDLQPVSDPMSVSCESGLENAGGGCDTFVRWQQDFSRTPDFWSLFIDNQFVNTAAGPFEGALISDVVPGEHTISMVGRILPDPAVAFVYDSCFIDLPCTVECANDCGNPIGLFVEQQAYGATSNDVSVVATWFNGETPYQAGIDAFVDGANAGSFPNDGDGNSVIEAALALDPGTQVNVGIRGNCGALVSNVAAEPFLPVSENPVSDPFVSIVCSWDDAAQELSADWEFQPDRAFTYMDIFSDTDAGLTLEFRQVAASFVGVTFPAGALGPDDRIGVRVYEDINNFYYGSEIVFCESSQTGNFYIPGICGLDAAPNIAHVSAIANFVFFNTEPACRAGCDPNGDGTINIADPSFTANFIFRGGPAPLEWVDQDGDEIPDSICLTAPEEDCTTSNPNCEL